MGILTALSTLISSAGDEWCGNPDCIFQFDFFSREEWYGNPDCTVHFDFFIRGRVGWES